MGAVVGLNLQEGKAEFVEIVAPFGPTEEWTAADEVAHRMEKRLNLEHLRLPRFSSLDKAPHAVGWTGED